MSVYVVKAPRDMTPAEHAALAYSEAREWTRFSSLYWTCREGDTCSVDQAPHEHAAPAEGGYRRVDVFPDMDNQPPMSPSEYDRSIGRPETGWSLTETT